MNQLRVGFIATLVVGAAACSPGHGADDGVIYQARVLDTFHPRHFDAVSSAPIDFSWSRIGRPVEAGRLVDMLDYVNTHPRLAGATYVDPSVKVIPSVAQRAASGPTPDWYLDVPVTAAEPLNVSGAARTASFFGPVDSAYDKFFVYGRETSTPHFIGILDGGTVDLPAGTPFPAGSVRKFGIDSRIDGSAISLSLDSQHVYGVASSGRLYSVEVATGGVTPGWSASGFALGAQVSWSSPWIDYSANAMFIADLGGNLSAINLGNPSTMTGPSFAWINQGPVPQAAHHSTPIVWDGFLWVGNDAGNLRRMSTGGGELRQSKLCEFCTGSADCGTATCSTYNEIWGTPYIDAQRDFLLIGVNNRVIQIKIGDPTFACPNRLPDLSCAFTPFVLPGTTASRRFFSSVIVDPTGTFVYAVWNNRLYRAPYGASGISGAFVEVVLAIGSTGTDIRSSPLMYIGTPQLWIGDRNGRISRFDTSVAPPWSVGIGQVRSGQFSGAGGTFNAINRIDSTPVIDYGASATGAVPHVYFSGYRNNTTIGRWIQTPQLF